MIVWAAAGLLLAAAAHMEAKVKLPSPVADGMVLQRGRPVQIWGLADAGEAVTVKLDMKKAKACSTVADDAGRWCVTLPAMQAGGPYRLQVNDIEIADVLVGDVWLCSGQSNMELPVSRVTDKFAREIASYENDKIRQFTVPKVLDFHAPQETLPAAAWKPCTQENVMSFSALAYFFAREAYEKTGVPIGLVNASWGGTPVEAWISEEGLQPFPLYLNDKRIYEDDGYLEHIRRMEGESFMRWNKALYEGDAGLHEATPWYAAEYDDSAWTEVDMFDTAWGNNGLNPVGGSHWLRKVVEVPGEWDGQEAVLRMGCIVDADSVYVNGVFVGNTTYQYPPRIYKIPAGVLKGGSNSVTVRIVSNGGQPGFVREKPYKIICGGGEVGLEGKWKYHVGAPMQAAPASTFLCYKPVCLYNAMIAPLAHCTFKGVIWYQGESNVERRNEYADLLTAMIADWRRTFGDASLPFYIMELADFLPKDDLEGRRAWAEMREEQAKAAQRNEHATLIPNADLGEWNDIHPLDKLTPAKRVVEAAYQ
ncbi:MAG: sialate O-acetylesterase [Prevotellaceae bacterium]|nr:sialate O-acetylesterase [Prevotellaceae bacterium]